MLLLGLIPVQIFWGYTYYYTCKAPSKVIYGDGTGITNSAISVSTEVRIDEDVLIGSDCKIYDSDFHSVEYNHRMERPDVNRISKPIHIRRGAWIGAHSIILKGVSIGERSVIGAGSVVTKDVPKDEVWAGNPTKFIKRIQN